MNSNSPLSSSAQPMTRRERRERERAAEAAARTRSLNKNAVEQNIPISPGVVTGEDTGATQPMTRRERWATLRESSATEVAEELQQAKSLEALPPDERQYPEHDDEVDPTPGQDPVTELDHDHDEAETEDEQHESLPAGYVEIAGTHSTPEPVLDQETIRARKAKKRRRTIVMLTSFVSFLVLLAGVGIGVRELIPGAPRDYEGPGGQEVHFTVNPGEGPIVIGNRLVEEDIVASTRAFTNAVEEAFDGRHIQPGEYQLREQMSAADAATALLRVNEPSRNYVPVASGTRINEVFEDIEVATQYSVDEIEEAAADPTVYGLPENAPSLEGYIAVGDYTFPQDSTPEEILELMVEPTMEEFDRLGISDPDEQFRLVTIASLLEAEALPDDFQTVAGIIENRLNPANAETGGLLQIDATVIYGMGVRQLQFSAEDRDDASNEYNTYVHQGLPPGPIGAPSIRALDAAADPEDNDYYYWVTTNIETGETKFSDNYEQHQRYQQEYRDYCEENPEICGG